ncbi:hypothetical protein SUGI_0770420 [Cryptomeria japonica]|uniref:uncharacterized protein LOC131040231 n=1 Tax=Cryptomeria japonica TaxID=3369 RepID=UPI002414B9B4|nr:uncharacterized protein LOC131040231 [Cryptomeria japonica]GLJ37870.1 hypothetical protein SUGI_0770420 [Cryptomeria japonica]
MKFTNSPVVELPVGGEVLHIEQDNGSMHVGTSVWPCSLLLVKFVQRCLTSTTAEMSSEPPNPYAQILQFNNKRGVELGTGCGVAGMGLALLGLDVVLTDIAPVLPALKRNVKKNTAATSLKNAGKPGCSAGRVKISQLYWNNEKQIQVLKPPFDFIIATDVVYLENIVEPLIFTMNALAGPSSVILLGYQIRSPEAHRLFWEICPRFFSVEKVPREYLHSDYAYEESDVYILRKKTN